MGIIKWIVTLPLVVGAVLFALAHPQTVPLTLNPFQDPIELPLYFVALCFLGAGFFLGAIIAWVGMGTVRKDRRQYKKEIKKLTKENESLKEEVIQSLEKKETQLSSPSKVIEVEE